MPPQDPEQARWFSEEIQPHEGVLRGYLRSVVEWSDVDDLVQDVYVRLLRARQRRPIGSPRGLLFAAARNAARDLFRHRAVARSAPIAEIDASGVLAEEPDACEVACRHQENELLEAAIRALPERCRTVLILRKFENLSHREIAARMGISHHTVEAQLTKALNRCEEFFTRRGALPPR